MLIILEDNDEGDEVLHFKDGNLRIKVSINKSINSGAANGSTSSEDSRAFRQWILRLRNGEDEMKIFEWN